MRAIFTFWVLVLGQLLMAQTNVPAIISSNQIWDVNGSPYIINQNTYADTGVKIIVKPGTIITATGAYSLSINGEFQAKGKWDSVISISKLNIDFSSKSRDYNAQTGRGACFEYCDISGYASGYKSISATMTSLHIDHCNFTSYFALYLSNNYPYDTIYTNVTNSSFRGDQYGYGTAISCSIMTSKLHVENCLFNAVDQLYAYGNVNIINNTFHKMRSVKFSYMFGQNNVNCNRFINMSEGINLDLSGLGGKGQLFFNNNTLDSIGNPNSAMYANVSINRSYNNYPAVKLVSASGNNFLSTKSNSPKVAITGTNQTPTKTDTIDFKNNFWNSNDSTTIAGFIKDYNDDIYLYGRINFSGYSASAINNCSYQSSCNKADFSWSNVDSNCLFTDKTIGQLKYSKLWKFGDGTQSNDTNKNIHHIYPHTGAFNACLLIFDENNHLCDSICHIVMIRAKSDCHALFNILKDSTHQNGIYIINKSTGTNNNTHYYWTFGDNTGSTAAKPNHQFAKAGVYGICLTIFDSMANCYSTYCDSIRIDSNGVFIFIMDERDLTQIDRNDVVNQWHLYPNPNNGVCLIELSALNNSSCAIEVYNQQGQVVYSSHQILSIGNNSMPLNVNHLSDGLYSIRIVNGINSYTQRLIIQH